MVCSRMRLERIKRGLTQKALADKTGGIVSQVVISQLEHGRRPRPDEALALAYALKVSEQELFAEQMSET